LMTGVGGGVGGSPSPARLRLLVAGRLALGAAAGLLLGGYTALELLVDQPALQFLVVCASVVAVCFVLLLSLPRAGGPLAAPALALLWGCCCGLALLLHAETPVRLDGRGAHHTSSRLFPDSKVQVEAEIYRATKASLLAVVAAHALLMAFALKLKMTSALRRRAAAGLGRADQSNGAGMPTPPAFGSHPSSTSSAPSASFSLSPSDLLCGLAPSAVFNNYCAMLRLEGSSPAAMALQRLASEGLAWVPTIGNLLTLTAVALGIALNAFLNGGSGGLASSASAGGGVGAPEAIFMLAPLLLLLSQDPLVLPGLSERQRYAPPQLAISGYLLAAGVVAAVADVLAGRVGGEEGGAAGAAGLPPGLHLVKELGLAALAIPHHLLFLHYLWTFKTRAWGLLLLLSAPVCLLPLAMCDEPALRYFGAVGGVVAVVQYFSMKHVRR
ncbi:hypothetical protein Agub_g15154, partial [Astrephomene gubernaculifera]